ncbi:UNVERIFIED_CONTAM: hypothetical protein FKN15_015482 [Acipenser sinensis]
MAPVMEGKQEMVLPFAVSRVGHQGFPHSGSRGPEEDALTHKVLPFAVSRVGHQGFPHSGSRGPEEDALTHKQCKPHKRPVCGSNGKTYRNHCELHRDACLTGLKIQVSHDGHCEEVLSGGMQGIQFQNYDNGDSHLDSNEFLKFIQHNETTVNITNYMDEENNRLLRSLCVDALIELSDENADWKLSFNEFLNCLKPGFNPTEKKCALEDENYEDGAETQVECNRCVCACGNWVCTAMICDAKDKKEAPEEDTDLTAQEEMTEEEWTRRVEELNKHQVRFLTPQ